jgi:PAS domain S-box-containing protein
LIDRAETFFVSLRDARIAPHAAGNVPVWAWSTDGEQILFANAVGAAIFGGETVAAVLEKRFDASHIAATAIARLNATLVHGAAPRLEKLRGFGAGFGRTLLCQCARISLGDQYAVLVVAAEPVGPNLPFNERVRRLTAGLDIPLAAFAADASLIHANDAAAPLLAGRNTLGEIRGSGDAALEIVGQDANIGTNAFTLARFAPIKPVPAPAPDVEPFDLAPITQALVEKGAIEAPVETQPPATAEQPVSEVAPGPAVPEFPPEPVIEPVQEELAEDPAQHEPVQEQPVQQVQNPGAPLVFEPAPEPADIREERRHPLRFVWQMDADGRFSLASGEFIEVIGPSVAAAFGRPWSEIVEEFALDPNDEVRRAIATRNTWSGITLDWPVEGSDRRLPVELSGLPIFDRDRLFRGYRGFGVCRDIARIDDLMTRRFVREGDPQDAPQAATARPENIVPFRNGAEATGATLTPTEHTAFRELSSRLTARLQDADKLARAPINVDDKITAGVPVADIGAAAAAAIAPEPKPDRKQPDAERPLLDRLPVGVLIHRHSQFIYANPSFLEWTGHRTLAEFSEAGGLDSLFIETHDESDQSTSGQSLRIVSPAGERTPVEARLFTLPYDGSTAMALVLLPASDNPEATAEAAATVKAAEAELTELKSILEIAADGVLVLDRSATILQANNRVRTIFSAEAGTLEGTSFFDLFAPDSARIARDCFDWLSRTGAPRTLSEGRDVIGKLQGGGMTSLHMTMGRIGDGELKFCALIRDITAWKKSQEELLNAKRTAEKASTAKSEFLAKISHEMRTPLNAIIGFSEVMMSERFGPVGNDRYRDYLHDIHTSGEHVVSLLNDLLDLSKIEAGKLDLAFTKVNLNEVTQQTVALMQPQAARERIILRQALAENLPPILADQRSVRQIALNLLSNAVKFTGAGGQVIVSTALSDRGDVILRVKDTGAGMTEKEIETALEPFRQLATSARYGSGGTGLGLPLTKALTEANRATFSIRSAVNAGTLIEIVFPAAEPR